MDMWGAMSMSTGGGWGWEEVPRRMKHKPEVAVQRSVLVYGSPINVKLNQ